MRCLYLFLFSAALCFANYPASTMRCKLVQHEGKPALETADRKFIALEGDHDTEGILKDKRLANADLEAKGHFTSGDRFTVDPIHTKALFVHKDGKRYAITYWCDLCAIR